MWRQKIRYSLVLILALLTLFVGSFWGWQHFGEPEEKSDLENINPVNNEKKSRKVSRKISYSARLTEAEKLIDHQYYAEAAKELNFAIKERPELIEPYLILAEIYLQTGDLWKLNNLTQALKQRFPEHDQVLVLQVQQLLLAERFGAALDRLDQLETLPPELEFYQAVLLALQNDHSGAQAHLKELDKLPTLAKERTTISLNATSSALGVTPKLNKKINDLQNIYLEFEDLAEWENPHMFAEISKALSSHEEFYLARAFADNAIKEDVRYIDGWLLRGYANLSLQKYEAAVADLRQAYELDPIRPEAQYFLALALYELGRFEQAALFFEKALDYEFPFAQEVRWKLVEIFTKQKKYDRALDLYQDLLDRDSSPKQYLSALHTALDLAKDPRRGVAIADQLLAENPESVFAGNLKAWALIGGENYAEAQSLLRKLERQDPENPRTQLHLGMLAQARGQLKRAQDYYTQAYEFGADKAEFNTVVNLAADKYNVLVAPPEPQPRTTSGSAHSP